MPAQVGGHVRRRQVGNTARRAAYSPSWASLPIRSIPYRPRSLNSLRKARPCPPLLTAKWRHPAHRDGHRHRHRRPSAWRHPAPKIVKQTCHKTSNGSRRHILAKHIAPLRVEFKRRMDPIELGSFSKEIVTRIGGDRAKRGRRRAWATPSAMPRPPFRRVTCASRSAPVPGAPDQAGDYPGLFAS